MSASNLKSQELRKQKRESELQRRREVESEVSSNKREISKTTEKSSEIEEIKKPSKPSSGPRVRVPERAQFTSTESNTSNIPDVEIPVAPITIKKRGSEVEIEEKELPEDEQDVSIKIIGRSSNKIPTRGRINREQEGQSSTQQNKTKKTFRVPTSSKIEKFSEPRSITSGSQEQPVREAGRALALSLFRPERSPQGQGKKEESLKDLAKIEGKNLVQYAAVFFGTRNGITFEEANLVDGKNFTNETLSYMTPAVIADKITNIIIQFMPYSPIVIFECCAGIGGNTLSFLDNSNISRVFSYEINDQRRKMLENNIKAYGLTSKSVLGGEFAGIDSSYAGSVLYLDPPWLPNEIPGHKSNPSQYIRHGMKIGNKTIEQWMEGDPELALVMMRVPPPYTDENGKEYKGYTLDDVPGWKIYDPDDITLPKSRLIIAVSEKGMTLGKKNNPVKTDKEWLSDLKKFLTNHLSPIVKNKDLMDKFFAEDNMNIWAKAFTYRSADTTFNYEELEKLGDSVLKLTFVVYLQQRFPDIKKDGLSKMQDRYASKAYQSILSRKFGFPSYVRSAEHKINIFIQEDILESFLGALFTIGNRVGGAGFGYAVAQQYTNYIYKEVDYSVESLIGRPTTVLKETFEGLDWGHAPITRESQTDEGVYVELEITDAGYEYLRARNIPVEKVIGRGSGNTAKEAKMSASQSAVSYLRELGITPGWVDQQKKENFSNSPLVAKNIPAFKQRLKKEGFVDYRLDWMKEASEKGKTYVSLVGIRPDGTEKIIDSTYGPNQKAAKIALVEKYANRTSTSYQYYVPS